MEESTAAPVLQLYNTMTKQKEVFRSGVPGEVSMYVCGVTPYDYSHIGHARAYVCFDVVYRSGASLRVRPHTSHLIVLPV